MTELDLYRYDDLERRIAGEPELLLPWTGELVDLRYPDAVAAALDQVREQKNRLDQLRALLEDVLVLESRRQGTKTLHLRCGDAVISGGDRTDYDPHQLATLLRQAGMPEERIAEIVVETVSYKVNAAKAKHAAGANPDYAAAVAQARTVTPAPWRVTIRPT